MTEWTIVPVLPALSPRLMGLGLRAGPPRAEKLFNIYYVYIIHSQKLGKIYKGFTIDLRKRISEHNRGKMQSTKSGIPWRLIYYQGFVNKKDARKEEMFLKTGKGRERLKYLLKNTLEGWLSGL